MEMSLDETKATLEELLNDKKDWLAKIKHLDEQWNEKDREATTLESNKPRT